MNKIKTAMNRVIDSYSANYEQAKTEYEKGRLYSGINFAHFILSMIDEYKALAIDMFNQHKDNPEFISGVITGGIEFSDYLVDILSEKGEKDCGKSK